MDDRTEALLYAASRRQHLKKLFFRHWKIRRSYCVIASLIQFNYQGIARVLVLKKCGISISLRLMDVCLKKTLFLSVSVETGKNV